MPTEATAGFGAFALRDTAEERVRRERIRRYVATGERVRATPA